MANVLFLSFIYKIYNYLLDNIKYEFQQQWKRNISNE